MNRVRSLFTAVLASIGLAGRLTWLIDREKSIGASDAESYFENILPLKIRILERRQQAGQDVKEELTCLRRMMKDKLTKEIPPARLPEKPNEQK
jgi:hypothetical protein